MRKEQVMVRDFHRLFGHPIANKPTFMPLDRVAFRASLMREEVEEFIDSTDIVQQVDAICDLIYFALGTMVEIGVDASDVFNIIHQCNLNKLVDNKPIYREDGKVLKPENWVGPEDTIRAYLKTRDHVCCNCGRGEHGDQKG